MQISVFVLVRFKVVMMLSCDGIVIFENTAVNPNFFPKQQPVLWCKHIQ